MSQPTSNQVMVLIDPLDGDDPAADFATREDEYQWEGDIQNLADSEAVDLTPDDQDWEDENNDYHELALNLVRGSYDQ